MAFAITIVLLARPFDALPDIVVVGRQLRAARIVRSHLVELVAHQRGRGAQVFDGRGGLLGFDDDLDFSSFLLGCHQYLQIKGGGPRR